MRALILNSGMGRRMGSLTSEVPKCMTKISETDTILSRQLKLLEQCGINEVVMTTGLFKNILVDYCNSLALNLRFTFINNPLYETTNYIYSIYCAKENLDDDILMMHGDLVFELEVLQSVLKQNRSCMTVSSTLPIPSKDFKAVIKNDLIQKIGIEFFENSIAALPLYKINKTDWNVWMNRIILYCESDKVSCYAENAFNEVSELCHIYQMDFADQLCAEIDTMEDLELIKEKLTNIHDLD